MSRIFAEIESDEPYVRSNAPIELVPACGEPIPFGIRVPGYEPMTLPCTEVLPCPVHIDTGPCPFCMHDNPLAQSVCADHRNWVIPE